MPLETKIFIGIDTLKNNKIIKELNVHKMTIQIIRKMLCGV